MASNDTKAPAVLPLGQGSQHNDERPCEGTSPRANSTTYERKREQQQARDAWRELVGTDAERASRGGVSWL